MTNVAKTHWCCQHILRCCRSLAYRETLLYPCREHLRPHKVFIFLIRITGWVDLVMSWNLLLTDLKLELAITNYALKSSAFACSISTRLCLDLHVSKVSPSHTAKPSLSQRLNASFGCLKFSWRGHSPFPILITQNPYRSSFWCRASLSDPPCPLEVNYNLVAPFMHIDNLERFSAHLLILKGALADPSHVSPLGRSQYSSF